MIINLESKLHRVDIERPENYHNPYDYYTPSGKLRKEKRADINNPRCKTLDRFGMGKFDTCKNIAELKLKVPQAIKMYENQLKTQDLEQINRIIKLGIVREVRALNSRIDAKRYAKTRP